MSFVSEIFMQRFRISKSFLDLWQNTWIDFKVFSSSREVRFYFK
ncbi:hypothetical protein pb186bvf_021055 [Paramecium bursaria]